MTETPTSAGTYAPTQRLLVAELDAERFSHPGYLPWFYGANPRGAALEEHVDDDGRRVGHYAVLPTRFRHGGDTGPFIFSSNVATDSTQRRGGYFRTMADRIYARALATGAPAMVAVTNEQSTVVVVDRFGWTLLTPMGARIVPPVAWRAARRIESIVVSHDYLRSDRFADLTADLDWVPTQDWATSWDTEFARWRLSRPDAGYVVHVDDDAIAVSAPARAPLGIPACVLLKIWPRPGASLPVHGARCATAAARFHRTPVCVYAGWNRHARVPGVKLPRRFQPSPLNVVLKVLDPARIDSAQFRLDTWEFLDMDAY